MPVPVKEQETGTETLISSTTESSADTKEEAKTILKNEKKENLKRFIRFYSRNINVNIQSYLESKTTTNDSQ